MTINHHLTEETLLSYAAGTLPEAFNLIVAAHVSLCDTCRATLESLDTVGGAIIDGLSPENMAEDSLARTMANLDAAPADPVRATGTGDVLPAPLHAYAGGTLDDVRWRPVAPGVKQAILPTSSTATARLLKIAGGVSVPDHSHEGLEMTLVLQGAFRDEEDRFARGDIELADGSVSHTPVAEQGEDCICLAVTEGPLKFKGFLPKVAQKFARI